MMIAVLPGIFHDYIAGVCGWVMQISQG